MVELIKKYNNLIEDMKKKRDEIEKKYKCLISIYINTNDNINLSIFNSTDKPFKTIYNDLFVIEVEEQYLKAKKDILIKILEDMKFDLSKVNL